MKTKFLIIILITLFIVIGCKQFKRDSDNIPAIKGAPVKVTNRFIRHIDNKNFNKAFNLWDFSFEIKSKGYKRYSKEKEVKRWRFIRGKWIKEQSKPYVETAKQSKFEAWVFITWDTKLRLDFDPKPNSVPLVLRFIKGKWKIIGVGYKF